MTDRSDTDCIEEITARVTTMLLLLLLLRQRRLSRDAGTPDAALLGQLQSLLMRCTARRHGGTIDLPDHAPVSICPLPHVDTRLRERARDANPTS